MMASGAPHCPPAASTERVVPVRFYNQSRLSENSLQAIVQIANRVWAPYRIVIEMSGKGDGINIVVSGDDASAPTGDGGAPTVIGTTMFSNGHATPNIHLSVGAAEQLVNWSADKREPLSARPVAVLDAIVPRVLGVALAHELAHYLLDTSGHSREGLLRGRLSLSEMENPQSSRLRLSCAQRQALFGQ